MAEDAAHSSPMRRFDMRELWRVALWGLAAGGTMTLAVFVSTSDAGNQRLELALASIRGTAEPAGTQLASNDDAETRRLFETVQRLTTDRERLMARLNALERNFDDLTGSIARNSERASGADAVPQSRSASPSPALAWPPAPLPLDLAPIATAPATIASTPSNAWGNVPVPRPSPMPPQTQAAAAPGAAPGPTPGKQEYGIDLGVAPNADGLRALWAAVKSRHESALEGLRPIMVVRERAPGSVEFRLVAGPLPTAAAAARLCATLGSVSATCQPAVFEGQRLALR